MLLILMLFLGGTAQAQNEIEVIFESPEGMRMARFNSLEIELTATYSGLLDANGDGIADLVMTTEDDEGNLQDLLVVSVNEARPREVFWRVEDVQATLGLSEDVQFIGFADPFGIGVRHAIFADGQDVHLYDTRDNTLSWFDDVADGPVSLVGVLDLTGDGFEDLVIYLSDTRQVLVYGLPR